MKKFENPVIVIGGGANGLGLIRNFGRKNIDVYCVVSNPNFAIYSRHCKEYAIIPGVENNIEVLRRFLASFEKRLTRRAVLFPTGDVAVLNVAYLLDEFDSYVASIPPFEAAETLVMKEKFYKSLIEKRIPHPETYFCEEEDLPEIGERLVFPVYVKPSISPLFYGTFGRKGFVAYSKDELQKYIQLAEKHNFTVMIQEIIPGSPRNNYQIYGYFNKESKPITLFLRRKLRQPTFFSISSASVSVPMSIISEPQKIIIDYLSSIKYRGICGVEFKRDPRDGVFKLLEVNARTGWHNVHPVACGLNDVLYAYREAVGEEITEKEPIEDYATDVYCINMLMDLETIRNAVLQRKLVLRDILSSLIGKKHWLIYDKEDALPFFQQLQSLIIKKLMP